MTVRRSNGTNVSCYNGNMVKDLNKGISMIEYNSLNLSRRVTFTGVNNPVNEYVYSSGGKKLSVIHKFIYGEANRLRW